MNIDDFTLEVGASKNAARIMKGGEEMAEIEKRKPRNCDCECGFSDGVSERDTGNLNSLLKRRSVK